MKIFTATDITLMGTPHAEFGQTYWGEVEEQSHPVRFNLKGQHNIMPGQQFVAQESEERKSAKGSPYTQLKKVSLSEGVAEVQQPMFTQEEIEEDGVPIVQESPGYVHAKETRQALPTPTAQLAPMAEKREVPAYEVSTNARWAIGMAYREYAKVMGTPEDGGGDFPFDAVLMHAQALMKMFDDIVGGD